MVRKDVVPVSNTIPPAPTDRVRLHVALWKMSQALGMGWTQIDASRPDHELVEEIAARLEPALARAIVDGFEEGERTTDGKKT